MKRAVAQDTVLKRKLDNAEERKTKCFAVEIERAVKRSSTTEKQFATAPNTEPSGGPTSSSESDRCGSSIANASSQAVGSEFAGHVQYYDTVHTSLQVLDVTMSESTSAKRPLDTKDLQESNELVTGQRRLDLLAQHDKTEMSTR